MVIKLKKNVLFSIVLLSIILCGYLFLQITYKSEFEKFTYDSGKLQITKYLENNRRELENIANELYKSKSSKKRPYKNIEYSSYCNYKQLNSFEKSSFVQFDFAAQGMNGGQYYGLIYSKDSNIYDDNDLFIYDENNEIGKGNNVFIREKIANNWYYYYDDYDGKVKVEDIK